MLAPLKKPAPERTHKVRSGDVQIAIKEYAIAHPITLVLVHGYPDTSAVWDRVLAPLAARYRLVTYDVRGFGASTAPANHADYSLEWLSKDFRAVLDTVSPDRPVHLLAHDWGSLQSWESVTDVELQKRISSYTAISGPCLDHLGHWMKNAFKTGGQEKRFALRQMRHSWYIWMMQLPWLAPALLKRSSDERFAKMMEKTEGIKIVPAPTRRQDSLNGIWLYRINMLKHLRNPRQRHTSVPVQQIVPLKDNYVLPEASRAARPWVKQLWVREVDAKHWFPVSRPELLAQQVQEFIDFVEGGAPTPELELARINTSS